MTEDRSEEHSNVKFCVVAFIDLRGFSQHLEAGSNDLRTIIGNEALSRLGTLNEAELKIRRENIKSPEVYPKDMRIIRINDSIVFGIDLPKLLMPAIGEQRWTGLRAGDLRTYFTEEELETEETYLKAYNDKVISATSDLVKFLGLVARTHVFIQGEENKACYPGPKTIVSTGFRRPFLEDSELDFLSANFAFSNAFTADKSLSGSEMYVDEVAIELACHSEYARNILRIASYQKRIPPFSYMIDKEDGEDTGSPYYQPEPVEVVLFKKGYKYLKLRASALEEMQILVQLGDFLNGTKKPHKKADKFLCRLLDRIRNANMHISTFGNWMGGDGLSSYILEIPEILANGEKEHRRIVRRFSPELYRIVDEELNISGDRDSGDKGT